MDGPNAGNAGAFSGEAGCLANVFQQPAGSPSKTARNAGPDTFVRAGIFFERNSRPKLFFDDPLKLKGRKQLRPSVDHPHKAP